MVIFVAYYIYLMHLKSDSSKNKVFVIILIIFFLGIGCRPTLQLTEGQYLLTANKVKVNTKDIDKKEVESYCRQKPNRKTFMVFYLHLGAHNLSQQGKPRKWKKWLGRVIGEEPSVFDSILMDRTNNQFLRYMQNQAYYGAEVESEVKLSKKKAKVIYTIKAGEPVYINEVDYKVYDTTISDLVYNDTASKALLSGERMKLEFLQNERRRIVNQIRDSGYYKFNTDYVRYVIDTNDNKASILVEIDYALKAGEGNLVSKVPHKKFWIKDVFFFPDFKPQLSIQNKQAYFNTFDTTKYGNYYFVFPGKPNIRPKIILKTNLIEPLQLFNRSAVYNTNQHLRSLKLFRLNNINFEEIEGRDSLLNCMMQLTPFTYQNYSVNVEATNTKENVGLGGYVNYQHKNIFKGAEIFNFKVFGEVGWQGVNQDIDNRLIYEVGSELKLETPSFILPFRMERFYKRFYPKTIFELGYRKQEKPDQFIRDIMSFDMGYAWNGEKSRKHFIYPLGFSFVQIPYMSDEFEQTIKDGFAENSYKDYFIIGPSYVITKSNSERSKYKNHSYFRWGVEAAGNLAYLINKNTNISDTAGGGFYTLLGLHYAQFFKSDFDYRFYNYLSPRNSLNFRFFTGFAIPYGNADVLPNVRQYFSGGSEGMRAWHARTLGPGTYLDTIGGYPNQHGDIKIELNAEYRFDITRALKGAYFIDAGNVWTMNKQETWEGGDFLINKFYKQLAIGTGVGIRYDFGFTAIRLDAGLKVRDPSIPGQKSWVIYHEPITWSSLVWNFGIGYPF